MGYEVKKKISKAKDEKVAGLRNTYQGYFGQDVSDQMQVRKGSNFICDGSCACNSLAGSILMVYGTPLACWGGRISSLVKVPLPCWGLQNLHTA